MPLIPGQGSGLYVGLILTAFYLILYYIFKVLPGKMHARTTVYAKPLPDNFSLKEGGAERCKRGDRNE
jgi:hypothetical protein